MARVDGHRAGCVCWQCDRAGEELAKHTAEIERLRIERDDAIRRGGEWARKATEEAECNKPLRAEIERLTGQLAECYRLTGADPDGNEDWRLAPQAVVEVKRLREQADAEIERLQRENAAAHLEADRIGREYAVLGSERDRLKATLAAAEADTKRLNGRIAALNGDLERARGVIERQALAINHAIQNTLGCAAIDAAKPEVKQRHAKAEYPPDGLATAKRLTAESLAREAARGDKGE